MFNKHFFQNNVATRLSAQIALLIMIFDRTRKFTLQSKVSDLHDPSPKDGSGSVFFIAHDLRRKAFSVMGLLRLQFWKKSLF